MLIRINSFLIVTFMLVHCYGQEMKPNRTNINPEAKKLNDSALVLVTKYMKYDEAIDLLDKALQIDSNCLSILYNKFSFQCGLKKYNEAIATANHIITVQPINPIFYYEVGMVCLTSGNPGPSEKFFNKAETQIDSIVDTIKPANKFYNDLLLYKAFIMILKDSTQASDSIFNELIGNTKDRNEKDLYSNKSL